MQIKVKNKRFNSMLATYHRHFNAAVHPISVPANIATENYPEQEAQGMTPFLCIEGSADILIRRAPLQR